MKTGKHYLCRNGEKIRILCTDRDGDFSVVGMTIKTGHLRVYTPNGTYAFGRLEYDIVSEFGGVVVNWDHMPIWVEWLAMDSLGTWCGFVNSPSPMVGAWTAGQTREGRVMIPEEYAPTFSGDWRDSVTKRPQK